MERDASAEALVRSAVARCFEGPVDRIEWIPAGVGLRRFARVHLSGAVPTLIARIDAAEDPRGRPPGIPPEPALEPIRALLEREGLPVPARYGADEASGVELLEDLGSQSLQTAAGAATREERRALYREACELVPRLQRVRKATGVEAFRRHLDAAHFRYKAELFIEWSLSSCGRKATAEESAVVHRAFAYVAEVAAAAPQRLAHRDFQSANLFVRPGGDTRPSRRLVMIDLQGALLAPPEYDLVCLLRDSYVELDEAQVASHLERVRPELPDAPSAEDFAMRFDLLTLTRKGKDHARFRYAAETRGDERFLAHLPATLAILRSASRRCAERDLKLAAFAELVAGLPDEPPRCETRPPCAE